MSRLDDVLRAAESLEPDDRLRLIAELWASLPPDHWAAPTAVQLAQLRRQCNQLNAPAPEPPAGRDPIATPAWDALRGFLLPGSLQSRPNLYHATRRFDLATIFVAMGVYSVLLAAMSMLQFQAAAQIYLGIFVLVVGIGQAVLEPYYDARRSSILVGAGFHTLCSLVLWYFFVRSDFIITFIGIVLMNGVLCGAAMGYMAGVLVGGVYLLADVLRGKFEYVKSDASKAGTMESAPPAPHPLDNVAAPGP